MATNHDLTSGGDNGLGNFVNNGLLEVVIDLKKLLKKGVAIGAGDSIDILALNAKAQVEGIVCEIEEGEGSAKNITIGDSASAVRYLAATSIQSAGTLYCDAATGTLPNSLVKNLYTAANAIRVTFASACSNARLRLKVRYFDFTGSEVLNND